MLLNKELDKIRIGGVSYLILGYAKPLDDCYGSRSALAVKLTKERPYRLVLLQYRPWARTNYILLEDVDDETKEWVQQSKEDWLSFIDTHLSQ